MIELVAFDVDGTLLRGPTLCECIAAGIGKLEAMRAIERLTARSEITAARYEMLSWYRRHDRPALLRHARNATLAPGARAGIGALQQAGVRVVMVSITWQFALEWLAEELAIERIVGTRWGTDDSIEHFWPEDKPAWLAQCAAEFGLLPAQVAAVGDSAGDLAMLNWAGTGYFVGSTHPALPAHVHHWPGADIAAVARDILTWNQTDATTSAARAPTGSCRDPGS